MATITSTELSNTGTFVNLGHPTHLNNLSARTVIVYHSPTFTNPAAAAYMFAKVASGAADGLRVALVNSTGQHVFHGSGSTGAAGTPYMQGTQSEIGLNNWQHLTLTDDGGLSATALKHYINGTESGYALGGLAGSGARVDDSANDLFLMNRAGLSREYFGSIGYIAMWSRVLNSTERSDARTNGPLTVPSGLVLCWANQQDYSTYAVTPVSRSTFAAGDFPPSNTALGSSGSASISFATTLSAVFDLSGVSGSSVLFTSTLNSTFALTGSVSAVSGQFVSKILVNNTGSSPLASTPVVWEWRQGAGIGVAPTSVVYGTGTTDSTGKFTATGLPTGAGELWMATTDYLNVYYERGTVT